MPHSVYLFLEQVAHGLYNGTAFYRNAVHMAQAGPITSENQAHFRHEASLNNVLFQEYNPEYPHQPYTLGYPGRPGGPDFYINVLDNSYIHGPGGQTTRNSDFITDADPCFAKVVKGFEAVDRLHRSSTEDTSALHDAMEHPVFIKWMRIRHDAKRIQQGSRSVDEHLEAKKQKSKKTLEQ
jgi:cyclophilin family peptidyl-prolyl cis-trans isomerase